MLYLSSAPLIAVLVSEDCKNYMGPQLGHAVLYHE